VKFRRRFAQIFADKNQKISVHQRSAAPWLKFASQAAIHLRSDFYLTLKTRTGFLDEKSGSSNHAYPPRVVQFYFVNA
jgi:hypothetical protein